jgi:L-aspartate oxidase
MKVKTDFLIIGSGVAGLTFALKVADHGSVAIVTKKGVMDTNTAQAQGGIASVFGKLDSFDLHIRDTLVAGDGLCNREVVEMVVRNGPERIHELIDMGVRFNLAERERDTGEEPTLDLGREGGHSEKRIIHAEDMTGRELERVLVDHVRRHKNIKLYENHIAIDLITYSTRMKRGQITTTHEDVCCGAYVLDREANQVKTFGAEITLLATGGSGKVYLYTSNPDIAAGDGIAMAYRAGATAANLEFVQFHPTCLYHPDAKNFLISEAVRGEGATLIDSEGNAFMGKYDPLRDLACRDVVARAIDRELKKAAMIQCFWIFPIRIRNLLKGGFPTFTKNVCPLGLI